VFRYLNFEFLNEYTTCIPTFPFVGQYFTPAHPGHSRFLPTIEVRKTSEGFDIDILSFNFTVI